MIKIFRDTLIRDGCYAIYIYHSGACIQRATMLFLYNSLYDDVINICAHISTNRDPEVLPYVITEMCEEELFVDKDCLSSI